jgi:hypothetical protein
MSKVWTLPPPGVCAAVSTRSIVLLDPDSPVTLIDSSSIVIGLGESSTGMSSSLMAMPATTITGPAGAPPTSVGSTL